MGEFNNNNNDFNDDDFTERERVIDAAELKPMKFFERLVAVFAAPVTLMKNIRFYPKFGSTIVIFLLMGIIIGSLTMRYSEITMIGQRAMMEERYGPEFTEFMLQSSDITGTLSQIGVSPTVVNSIAAASGAVSVITSALFNSLLMSCVLMILVKIFRGNVKFINLFAMLMHISVLENIGGALYIVFGVILSTSTNIFSLAFLNPGGGLLSPVYNILSAINVFSVWAWILYAVGLVHVCGLSKGKAITIACIIALGTFLIAGFISPIIITLSYDFAYNSMQSITVR